MTDLTAYFRREAAIHALPGLMAKQRAKDPAARSDRPRRGNQARKLKGARDAWIQNS